MTYAVVMRAGPHAQHLASAVGVDVDHDYDGLPLDEWTARFSYECLTGALLDRLTHHLHILEMNGSSYRPAQRWSRKRPD